MYFSPEEIQEAMGLLLRPSQDTVERVKKFCAGANKCAKSIHDFKSEADARKAFAEMEDNSPDRMKLHHPFRTAFPASDFIYRSVATETGLQIIAEAVKHSYPLHFTVELMKLGSERFSKVAGDLRGCSGVNDGNLMGSIFPIAHRLTDSANFIFDDEITAELRNTNVSKGVPASMVVPPFKFSYFGFGENQAKAMAGVLIRNIDTGMHTLEGAYVHSLPTKVEVVPKMVRDSINPTDSAEWWCLEFMFCGIPKAHIVDDATYHMNIYLDISEGNTMCANEQLVKNLNYYASDKYGAPETFPDNTVISHTGRQETIALAETDNPYFHAATEHLFKCLVYLNCAEVRQELVDKRGDIERQMRGISNKKKLRRMEKELKLNPMAFTIIRGDTSHDSTIDLSSEAGTGEAGTKRPHWRRGHMRSQHYGEGNKQIKIVRIKPVLINKELLGRQAHQQNYKVKR